MLIIFTYNFQSEELNRDMVFGAELLQSVSSDLIELKRSLQTLDIELQSQLSVVRDFFGYTFL